MRSKILSVLEAAGVLALLTSAVSYLLIEVETVQLLLFGITLGIIETIFIYPKLVKDKGRYYVVKPIEVIAPNIVLGVLRVYGIVYVVLMLQFIYIAITYLSPEIALLLGLYCLIAALLIVGLNIMGRLWLTAKGYLISRYLGGKHNEV